MAALLKLKDQGKIRAIGVSNATVEEMKVYGPIDSDQEKYSLLDRQIETDGTVAYCREHRIGILAYSPLANGLLTGKLRPDRQYGPGDLRKGNLRFMPRNVERVNAMLETLQPLAAEHHVERRPVGDRLDVFAAGHYLRALRGPRRGPGNGERRGRRRRLAARGAQRHPRGGPRLKPQGNESGSFYLDKA